MKKAKGSAGSGSQKQSSSGNQNFANYVIIGAAVAVLAILAFMLLGEKTPPAASPASGAAAELLLSAYDKGAGMVAYQMAYWQGENDDISNYTLKSSGKQRFAKVEGRFGAIEGYFAYESPEAICLEYGEAKHCAAVGNHSGMEELAGSLKALFPTRKAYMEQKEALSKLIKNGAIQFEGEILQENAGSFAAKKIAYRLDYSNLTVQQLADLGIDPASPMLKDLKEQKVAFWIDEKTGMVVRSLSTYLEKGIPKKYETFYSEILLSPPDEIALPNATLSPSRFYQFYQQAKADFVEKEQCRLSPRQEQPQCYKNLAYKKDDHKLCQPIDEENERETCMLIIAQKTKNDSICGLLRKSKDDCYINVAGQKGDWEICKKVSDAGRLEECANAAAQGAKIIEREKQSAAPAPPKNCEKNDDCKVFGAQYCAPKNSTGDFGSADEFAVCYASIPCVCEEGYCKFKKDEDFYACISKIEEGITRKFILDLIAQSQNKSG
ncbi:MAG: hypothetical protein N3F07_00750 [Candidatus Micrarchaeota archaeon]|nr:hypothetical protein [Candidatus Micrarchaeota archaeon]